MQTNFDSGNLLLEYTTGTSSRAHKYISRFGAPGRYVYVYPMGDLANMSNKGRMAYQRHMQRSKRFFQKIRLAYASDSFNVRPTSWHTALINIRRKDGFAMDMHVHITNETILSYRKRSDNIKSKWANVPRYKRNGILRNRG